VTGAQYTGWCLDPADCCVAKLCAGRQKDLDFVFALFDAQLVDRDLVRERLLQVPEQPAHKKAEANAALAHLAKCEKSDLISMPASSRSYAVSD